MVLAASCTYELTTPVSDPGNGKITLAFSVQLPDMTPATKDMADQPDGQLESLYLAVFDESGYLSEYIMATPDLAQVNGTRYSYTAKLSLSAEPRIIHFIGNGPSSIKFGTEEAVMAGIKATGKEDLYWYRKKLDSVTGVAPGLDETEGGMQIDEITRLNLTDIPLVRNFVKITLIDEAESFELKQYAVVNSLNDGMLAAYDAKTGEFVEYFEYVTSSDATLAANGIMEISGPKTYEILTSEGYDGNIPSVTSYVSPDEAWKNAVDSGNPYFVYERETPTENPTFIIAFGTYQNKDYYYKVDLRDNDGAYFPLLRNFAYELTLTEVSRAGYETIEEAANSAGSGDISTALETISLVYISDGVASLEVEYTEKVVTSETPVTLDFTFLTDVADDDSFGDVSKISVNVNDDYGLSGAAIAEAQWDGKNPGRITVTPAAPSATPKTQTLTIYAEYEKDGITKKLQRTVKYVVMTKRTMTAVCIPNEVPKTRGSEFALQITIPGGLSSGMFPLEFSIEAEKLTITPNTALDHMPVESGVSLTGNGSAFYFIKTLEWEDYNPLVQNTSILCYFKTNADISATDIVVANPYFENAEATLGNYDPSYFENLEFSVDEIPVGEENEVTFTFDMTSLPAQGNVTVTLSGVEPDPDYEGELTFIGVTDGKAQYSYAIPTDSGLTGHTFHLITSSFGSEAVVTLDAYRFIQASASCGRTWVQFRNVSLENAEVGIGKTTTFSYTYDESASGVPVTMTFTGLKPQDGDSRFVYNGDEAGTYTFTPNPASQTQEITLVTTTFGTGIGVSISATDSRYEDTSAMARRKLVIPYSSHSNNLDSESNVRIGNIKPGNYFSNWNQTEYLLATRMDSLGIVEGESNTIDLPDDVAENDVLYLQYYKSSNWNRTYYVATVTIKTLAEGGAISWQEQE